MIIKWQCLRCNEVVVQHENAEATCGCGYSGKTKEGWKGEPKILGKYPKKINA